MKTMGVGRMTLVIKRVKGKQYVYEQFRHGDVVVTKYIGPLEEMIRIWQLYKTLGKVEKLSERDLRRLARIFLQEYSKAIDSAVEKLCVVNLKESRAGRWHVGGPAGIRTPDLRRVRTQKYVNVHINDMHVLQSDNQGRYQ